jgi:Transposase domain (DUF772)
LLDRPRAPLGFAQPINFPCTIDGIASVSFRSLERFSSIFADLRRQLASIYSSMGRPSIDPELMIRMLVLGYCFGIRSERRLCDKRAPLPEVCLFPQRWSRARIVVML